MGGITLKGDIAVGRPTIAGFRIIGSLERTARALPCDLTVTCTDGSHGPTDPHTLGSAFDVRTHNLTADQKTFVLERTLLDLREPGDAAAPVPVSIGLATPYFYGQIEHPGEPGEHVHLQLRKGRTYPPPATRRLTPAAARRRLARPRRRNRKVRR